MLIVHKVRLHLATLISKLLARVAVVANDDHAVLSAGRRLSQRLLVVPAAGKQRVIHVTQAARNNVLRLIVHTGVMHVLTGGLRDSRLKQRPIYNFALALLLY